MKKKWFYRLLFSYFPIFFSLTSVLILLTFLLISDMSRRETVTANERVVRHIMEQLDRSIREIDGLLVYEIETNANLHTFFREKGGERDYFRDYGVSRKINELSRINPLIDSIYLYRFSDGMVMSSNAFLPLDRFGDRAFVESRAQSRSLYELSGTRRYEEFPLPHRQPVSVFSIVRKFPLLDGTDGVIVANIGLEEIGRTVAGMSSSGFSYVEIRDAAGNLVYAPSDTDAKRRKSALSQAASDVTGWTYVGGVYDDRAFRYASVFSYVWVAGGLLVVVSGTVWIAYATRRNYKPIEAVLARIQLYSAQKSGLLSGQAQDEFHFIGQAIDDLIERSNTYRKLHEEDAVYRRSHFFIELLEGKRSIGPEEWHAELKRLRIASRFREVGTAVYEIDRYADFADRYSHRDRYLLKFVLNGVIREMAEPHPVTVWTEWTAEYRVTALYQIVGDGIDGAEWIAAMAASVKQWVEKNLDFTVTVGVGGCGGQLSGISRSYSDAVRALDYKPSLGLNRVIRPGCLQPNGPDGAYPQLQSIRPLVRAFRTGEEDWLPMLDRMFRELEGRLLTRDEHVQLMNTFIHHLVQELAEMPADVRREWNERVLPGLHAALETFDLAADLEIRFRDILTSFGRSIREWRESRNHFALIRDVRSYIEREYANPDLSLDHLCGLFGLNGKYLSRLFKEAFGEKLIDFVVGVRIGQSKRLLEETSMPLQEVARAVGYAHVISFIRAFKKVTGTTPGEYRKPFGKSPS
ncbi:AraC family transcriptional regulator [Paenibacillus flagellatus]|uniref:HTH araC/xylS-type domain-containing protein n=1 Tax=Paenibacillus flagellatus TaxID=2211139 RepID=A0A2V5KRD2_9BACL|nr:AraC family transcriptional regulator [Paenibacillus flagellatus]PYI53987.1 hypothetical protein DLM86_15675 [Paenibacillus flagellatus]